MINNTSKFKRIVSHLAIIMMIFTAFAAFGIAGSEPSLAMEKICKISGSKVFVRKNAGTKYKALGTLKKGTYRVIKGSKKGTDGKTWYKVKIKGKNGYVCSKYAKVVTVSVSSLKTTGTVKVKSGKLLARSGPGTLYGTIGKISKGKKISITGKAKDVNGTYWYKTKVGSKVAYVSSKYVSTSKTTSASSATTSTTKKSVVAAKVTPTTTKATTTKTTTTTKPSSSSTSATTTTAPSSTDIEFTVKSISGTTGTAKTSSGSLNVRSGPATSYGVIGSVKTNVDFPVTGETTVNGSKWYQLTLNGKTGYASSSFVVTSQAKSIDTSDRTAAARNAAADWAIMIANDNTFHYGKNTWAKHFGCYYCDTNGSGCAKHKDGGSLSRIERSYCCNPFVTAAYMHGAGAPEVNCAVSSKRFGLANDTNKVLKNNPSIFKNITKPSKPTDLVKGDILLTNSHAVIYVGDGKIAHAASGDDNSVNSSSWNKSIRVDSFTTSSKYWKDSSLKIYRYYGKGKF